MQKRFKCINRNISKINTIQVHIKKVLKTPNKCNQQKYLQYCYVKIQKQLINNTIKKHFN